MLLVTCAFFFTMTNRNVCCEQKTKESPAILRVNLRARASLHFGFEGRVCLMSISLQEINTLYCFILTGNDI